MNNIPHESPYEIAKNIKERSEVLGITVAELFKKAEVAASTFTRWQSCKADPISPSYKKIIALLDELENQPNA